MQIERRAEVAEVAEIRAEGRTLFGHAAVFDHKTRIFDFTESIAPGAFKRTLSAGKDVLALVDHNSGRILARTRSGHLRLSEDKRGLAFELDVPNTTLGNDVLELAQRGDLGGMSFGFGRTRAGQDRWSGNHRTLTDVDLKEISVVSAFPAYPQTSVSARSRYAADSAVAAFLEAVRRAAESFQRR